MKQITISQSTLETLIESLEDTVRVCENVNYNLSAQERLLLKNSEKTAPFAVGYSRASINTVINQLKALQNS